MLLKSRLLATLAITAVTAFPAFADEAGEAEYMNACSTCHGAAGQGAGPMAQYMTVEVPSLRNLSKDNDGVFPMLKIIHIIDGRTGVRGHGSNMPVWGRQFKMEVEDQTGPFAAETYTRGKILSIAYYLESIQDE